MIRHLKSKTKIPIAVITNGSLFYLPEVREDLKSADAVLPSLISICLRLLRTISRWSATSVMVPFGTQGAKLEVFIRLDDELPLGGRMRNLD